MSIVGPLKLYAKLICGDEGAIGPGKALLLEAIGRAGSISAAARELGMSYRRAWLLVDAMNRCWAAPLVEAVGGSNGSRLTALGREVLDGYRALERRVEAAAQAEGYPALVSRLRDRPLPPAAPSNPARRA